MYLYTNETYVFYFLYTTFNLFGSFPFCQFFIKQPIPRDRVHCNSLANRVIISKKFFFDAVVILSQEYIRKYQICCRGKNNKYASSKPSISCPFKKRMDPIWPL